MSFKKQLATGISAATFAMAAGITNASPDHGHEADAQQTPTSINAEQGFQVLENSELPEHERRNFSPDVKAMLMTTEEQLPPGVAKVEFQYNADGDSKSDLLKESYEKSQWNISNIANVTYEEGFSEHPDKHTIQETIEIDHSVSSISSGGKIRNGVNELNITWNNENKGDPEFKDKWSRNEPIKADIEIAGHRLSDTPAEVLNTTTHEALHSLAVDHPNEQKNDGVLKGLDTKEHSIMSDQQNIDFPETITPMPIEHKILEEQFGKNTKTNAGDTEFTLNNDSKKDFNEVLESRDSSKIHAGFTQTIVDAGGKNDTLNISSHEGEASLDLRATTPELNNFTKTIVDGKIETAIAIPEGTDIENGVINKGSMRGNELDNKLTSTGKATAIGDKGADTFDLGDGSTIKDFSKSEGDKLTMPEGAVKVETESYDMPAPEKPSISISDRVNNMVSSLTGTATAEKFEKSFEQKMNSYEKEFELSQKPATTVTFKDANDKPISSVDLQGVSVKEAQDITLVKNDGAEVKLSDTQKTPEAAQKESASKAPTPKPEPDKATIGKKEVKDVDLSSLKISSKITSREGGLSSGSKATANNIAKPVNQKESAPAR